MLTSIPQGDASMLGHGEGSVKIVRAKRDEAR